MPAYLVLLPVEIARFTQTGALPRSGWLLVWAFAQALRQAAGHRRPAPSVRRTPLSGPRSDSSLLL